MPAGNNLRPKTEAALNYAGKRILITGACGYLAANISGLLGDTDCTIVRLCRPSKTPAPLRGAARVRDLAGDVRERAVWQSALEGTDIVFHLAAQTSTYLANDNPPADLNANVVPMLHLLEMCRANGWKPDVVFASTSTICGLPTSLPVNETHPDNPMTVYDLHKWMAEAYLKYYARQGFVRGLAVRLTNVYGPGPKSSSGDRGILNLMIRRALAGEALTVYGAGDLLRDYVYVKDAACAFLAAGSSMDAVNGQHCVVGSGQGHTIAQALNLVADRVARKTGKRVDVKHVEPPAKLSPIESRNFVADSGRFRQATGWQARWSLVEGIDATIEAFVGGEKM